MSNAAQAPYKPEAKEVHVVCLCRRCCHMRRPKANITGPFPKSMDPESALEQPPPPPPPLSIASMPILASKSYADPIHADNKDLLLTVLTAMVPVAISFPILPLMPSRITINADATISAWLEDMNYIYPPPLNNALGDASPAKSPRSSMSNDSNSGEDCVKIPENHYAIISMIV